MDSSAYSNPNPDFYSSVNLTHFDILWLQPYANPVFPFMYTLHCLLYCDPSALGRDLAHIIITHPLSDIYAQSLISASGYNLSKFTPWYLWSVQMVVWQDSMHCGASSGLDVLIRKWVPIRDNWLGLHVALCMSGTWSGHPNGQQYAQGICGRFWCIIRARCPNQKWGATQGKHI